MSERSVYDRRFWACSGVIFLDETLYVALIPLLPLFAGLFALSSTAIGLLIAGYPLLFLLSALPTGLTVDRVGVRIMLLVGTSLLIATSLMFAAAENAAMVFAARCVQGLASGMTTISGMAAVTKLGPSKSRGTLIGATSALAGLSTFAGPILGGYIAPLTGIRLAFLLPAMFGILVLALVYCDNWEKPSAITVTPFAIGRWLRDPLLIAGLICIFIDAFVSGAVATLVPLNLASQGLSTAGISTVLLCGAALGLAAALALGRLVDRREPVWISAGWTSLVLVLVIGLCVLPSLAPTVVLYALLIPMLRAGGTLAYAITSLSHSSRGSIGTNLGLMMSVWAFGATSGPVSAGVVADLAGFGVTMGVLSAIVLALGGILITVLLRGAGQNSWRETAS